MSEYPRQVVIDEPLWGFMEHCQIYCTAACCEKLAFEVSPCYCDGECST